MSDGWQSAVEEFPPGWRFPAGATWLAGWVYAGPNRFVSDLRAWVDHRVFLGLHGLPKPGLDERFLGQPGPPYAGFVVQVKPHRGARLLRLETRDPLGRWTEFFRTPITVDETAETAPPSAALGETFGRQIESVLRLVVQRPGQPLGGLADEVLASALASHVDALPVPPFHGALERPGTEGWLHYGRLAITGWLAHRTQRIVRMTALVDAVQETELVHGLPRDDIGRHFADLPGRETSQFLGHADLPANLASPALLKIFAKLEDGSKHLVFGQRFRPRIVAEGAASLPPRSRRLFAQSAWALRGAARRFGMPLGPAGQLMAQARAAWADFAAEAPASRSRVAPVTTPDDLTARYGIRAPSNSARMGILVATHNLNFEGAPWFIFELARHLASTPGIEVRIVSPHEGPLRGKFEELGMRVDVLPVERALSASSAEEFGRELESLEKGIDWSSVDLVIANTMVSFWAIHLAARRHKASLLYVHESSPIRRFFERILAPALWPLVQDAFKRATRVVFTADSTRTVHEHLNTERNFVLLPSWVNVDRIDTFAAAHDPRELRRKHGLDPDAVLLVNIGSVCERKGQHVYLRAVELLRDELKAQHPNQRIQFVMVGARPGLYLEALQQEAKRHRLEEALFLPETGEIYDFYRLADIFVCTSFEESFPRVLLESAAFRLPIVSTNVNGIAEMLSPDEAWLIPPGDRYQLGEAMKQAIDAHFAGDRTRAERARRAVEEKYGQSRSMPLHLLVAQDAASRGRR